MRQVVGFHNIILLLVETVGYNDFVRIFLGIDGMLLKTDVHFAEGHGGRVGSESIPESQVITIFHSSLKRILLYTKRLMINA